MDRKSTKNLRLDQRLTGRKNWISSAELEKELGSLQDVSHKIAEPKEEPESNRGSEAGQEPTSLDLGGSDFLRPPSTEE